MKLDRLVSILVKSWLTHQKKYIISIPPKNHDIQMSCIG
jgi:hypothetical protein